MNNEKIEYCQKCEQPMDEYRALSRVDNETYICADCGLQEALEEAASHYKSIDDALKDNS